MSACSMAAPPCSTSTTVHPSAVARSSTPSTAFRPTGSRSLVGSSSRSTFGRSAKSPAIASRCFSPPESVVGSRPSKPTRPTASSAAATRPGMSAGGTPVCSRPNTTSWVTSVEKSCASKSWNTMPRTPASSPTLRSTIDAPAIRISPVTSAAVKHGTSRARQRMSVDLPAPVAPITRVSVPGASASPTPSSAARSAPGKRQRRSIVSTAGVTGARSRGARRPGWGEARARPPRHRSRCAGPPRVVAKLPTPPARRS